MIGDGWNDDETPILTTRSDAHGEKNSNDNNNYNNNSRTSGPSQFLRHLEEIHERELLKQRRRQQRQQQQRQKRQQQALFLSSSELDKEIATLMKVGTATTVQRSTTTTAAAPNGFANFANFDSPEALEIVRDIHDSVSPKAASTLDVVPASIDGSSPSSQRNNETGSCGFQIFADDDDDDDTHDDDEEDNDGYGEDTAAATTTTTTTKSVPLPVPFSPDSQQQQQEGTLFASDVSNDTPTTCNRSLLTPTTNPQQKQHHISATSQDDHNNSTTDGRPPKHILHRSLSLGDALSPADDDSPPVERPRRQEDPKRTSATLYFSDDCFGPSSSSAEDDELKRYLQVPTMEELSSRGSLVPVNEDTTVEHGSLSNILLQSAPVTTKVYTERTNPPPPPPLKDDDSFSTVSSFTIGPNIHQRKNQAVQEKQLPRPTAPPFFWKTHPSVTVKINAVQQRQQLKPRMRRVVPNLKRVGTIDSYSTFGGSNDALRPSSCPSTSSTSSSMEDDGLWIDSKPYKIHEKRHDPPKTLLQQQVTTFQEVRDVARSVFSSMVGGTQYSFGRQNYY
jgi:hypothetical protein